MKKNKKIIKEEKTKKLISKRWKKQETCKRIVKQETCKSKNSTACWIFSMKLELLRSELYASYMKRVTSISSCQVIYVVNQSFFGLTLKIYGCFIIVLSWRLYWHIVYDIDLGGYAWYEVSK